MKSLNSFINFRSSRPNLQSSYISLDRWLTVGSPSGLDAKWKQNPFMRFAAVFALVFVIGVGNAWGDETITEDFENSDQEIHVDAQSNPVYNDQTTYDEEDSNAEIGWFVEHGTVSTDAKISGDRSLQMRAYYSKSSAQGTWNGALPYLESTTAVTGLKSITFKAKVSSTTNQSLLVDIKYSTDGSSWSAMKTNAVTPADATGIAYTTSATSYTYNIPSSSSSTSYYIKIAVSSSSRHTTNAASAGSKGNIKLIVDDIVFTYASSSPSCIAPSATSNGSITLSQTKPSKIDSHLVIISVFQRSFCRMYLLNVLRLQWRLRAMLRLERPDCNALRIYSSFRYNGLSSFLVRLPFGRPICFPSALSLAKASRVRWLIRLRSISADSPKAKANTLDCMSSPKR